MYFTKVELHNFGIYKGTHEMSLTDQIGNRNITLVGGLNGRGKTTFHDSILIALYGKQALKYIDEEQGQIDMMIQFQCQCADCLFTDYLPTPFILQRMKQAFSNWQKKLYGKVSMGVVRTTYIIDEEGIIEKVMPKVKPDTNANEILEWLEA